MLRGFLWACTSSRSEGATLSINFGEFLNVSTTGQGRPVNPTGRGENTSSPQASGGALAADSDFSSSPATHE